MKKKSKIILALSALIMAGSAYGAYHFLQPKDMITDPKARIESNFYQAINKSWLAKTQIPSDRPSVSAFSQLQDKIKDEMTSDIQQLASGKEKSDIKGMDNFLKFYQLTTDYKAREKEGSKSFKPTLEALEKLSIIDDLSEHIVERTLNNDPLPFDIAITPDLKNTSKNMVTLAAPELFLMSADYYQDKENKEQMTELFSKSAIKVLTLLDYSEKKAKELVEKALSFDSKLAKHYPSQDQLADIEATYHPKSLEEVKAYSKTFDFEAAAKELVGADISFINVENPKFFEAFDQIVTQENMADLRAYLLLGEALSTAPYLTDDLRIAAEGFEQAISGVEKAKPKEEAALNLATEHFSHTLSTYYGQKHFGPQSKKNVTKMIDSMVNVYKKRLKTNTWLTDETKDKAIEKLSQMRYYVGYPEEVPEEVDLMTVDTNKSLVDNIHALNRQETLALFKNFNKPVDKTTWAAPSYVVNAQYDTYSNSILFPAAILNQPLYSEKQSEAQNYGAIGMVIGHEITHAFDSNGARFDKEGNLSNWWTDADRKAFEKKTQAMVKLFDGQELYGSKINGKLTVTENTADAGGLSVSLEALQTTNKQVDLKEYFEHYAKIWRQKASLDHLKYLLDIDVHAPAEARVNIQLKNMDAFYKAYPIKEGDPMYLPKEKRVKIW